jgi:dTDP-4-dehydrorhamnose 3,5-epimerase
VDRVDRSEKTTSIEGVSIMPLNVFADERGAVLHMMRNNHPWFVRFGEVYFSEVKPGVIKAWKRHREMTQHFAVPWGEIRLGVFDDRPESSTKGALETLILGRPDNYCLVRIPPRLWYGFQGKASHPSLLANFTDLPHDPEESENLDWHDPSIPFAW